MKGAVQVISQLDQAAITQVEKTNTFQLEVNGSTYELTMEDFDIVTEDIPGWQVASDGDITVALDVTITPELEAEGMARDLVNRIQNIRKDKDFEVTDRIHIRLQQHDAVASAIQQYGSYIQAETLAESLELVTEVKNGTEIELPGELNLLVGVEK
jgi:isoleucyl-tRNA synthetase